VPWVSPSEQSPTLDKTDLLEFNKVFPDIVRDLTDTGRHIDIPRATKWFAKVTPSAAHWKNSLTYD
jgi:farnesyl diphosphate synthase